MVNAPVGRGRCRVGTEMRAENAGRGGDGGVGPWARVRAVVAAGAALLVVVIALVLWRNGYRPAPPTAKVHPATQAVARAAAAAQAVQSLYDAQTGLFCTATGNCWWWSANELIALSDYGQLAHTRAYLGDLATTYARAGALGPQGAAIGPFIDTWNDDDGWWGMAWLAAYRYAQPYQPIQAQRYLQLAEGSFSYLAGQWNTSSCGGGLFQNQRPTHTKDAIANELFLSLGANLYEITGSSSYLAWAQREWNWFQASGLVGPTHLVHDHLAPGTCRPAGTQYWTYNQGVILGGLAVLSKDLRPRQPIAANAALMQAQGIADCVIRASCGGSAQPPLLDARGILSEPCDTTPCTYGPAYQFKGIFVRNLAQLNAETGGYGGFLAANARSLWSSRDSSGRFGFYWDTPPPFYLPAGGQAPVDGSALDLLNTQL